MTTKLNEATVANVKAENPALFNAIAEEAKAEVQTTHQTDLEAAKNEGYAAGVKAENERIKSVEELGSEDTQDIISANKFNTDMTKEKVSVLIVEDQKAKTSAAADEHIEDAKETGAASDKIDASAPSQDDEKAQTISNIAAGANARENRKQK